VEAPSRPPARRTLTPAVLLAALFATACAGVSIAFVAGRGGLQLPGPSGRAVPISIETATAPPVAASSPGPTTAPIPTPSFALPSASAPPQNPAPTPAASLDPLTALAPCPGHPGCYLYTVRRGDTLSTIGDHWLIGVWILEALNPEVTDPSTIVVGQTLYLGRSPVVRLDPCPGTPGCYLYVVQSGDRLSTIAGRYGTTTTAILALNPAITNPNEIRTGQTIRLPGP
jgi:hypothetical protein